MEKQSVKKEKAACQSLLRNTAKMCQAVYERYDCQHEGSDFFDVWACEEYHKNPTFHCNMERGTYLIDGKCPGCRNKEKNGELQKRPPPARAKATNDTK